MDNKPPSHVQITSFSIMLMRIENANLSWSDIGLAHTHRISFRSRVSYHIYISISCALTPCTLANRYRHYGWICFPIVRVYYVFRQPFSVRSHVLYVRTESLRMVSYCLSSASHNFKVYYFTSYTVLYRVNYYFYSVFGTSSLILSPYMPNTL
jgi:hypothetical protein